MIVFCEDCGKKNGINPDQFKKGRVVFRCTQCLYKNNYLLESGSSPFPSNDEIIKNDSHLNLICSLPGVIGAFIHYRENGIIKNNMPKDLKKADLEALGKVLLENLSICLSEFEDTTHMILFVSNRNIVVKLLDRNLFLVVVCETYKAVYETEKYLETYF